MPHVPVVGCPHRVDVLVADGARWFANVRFGPGNDRLAVSFQPDIGEQSPPMTVAIVKRGDARRAVVNSNSIRVIRGQ